MVIDETIGEEQGYPEEDGYAEGNAEDVSGQAEAGDEEAQGEPWMLKPGSVAKEVFAQEAHGIPGT